MSYKTPLEILKSFKRDQPEYVHCRITGSLPKSLPDGYLLFNGPGIFQIGEDTYRTVLDGMAVLQQYRFQDGKIMYRSRIVQSESYKRNKAAGGIVNHELGTLARPDPNKFSIQRYWEYFTSTITRPTDNTVVNIIKIGDRLYALTETPFINEINIKDLSVKAKIDLRNSIPVHILTAHPMKDNAGNLWNIGTSFSLVSKYCVLKTETDEDYEKARVVGQVSCRWGLHPSYYHSFGMSENYLILVEQPLSMPLLSMATATIRLKPFSELMTYYPNEQSIIHVYNKAEERFLPVRFCTESFIVMHHINAFEDDNNQLIFDVCAHKQNSFLQDAQLERFGSEEAKNLPVEIWRFTLPLKSDEQRSSEAHLASTDYVQCLPQKFINGDLELPIINTKFAYKAYRYVYGLRMEQYNRHLLAKFDFDSGEIITWSEEHCIPGTPIFIESESENEDEGYIMAPVMNQRVDGSHFLLMLDARTMQEVGRALLPSSVDVPYTFHGTFEKFL